MPGLPRDHGSKRPADLSLMRPRTLAGSPCAGHEGTLRALRHRGYQFPNQPRQDAGRFPEVGSVGSCSRQHRFRRTRPPARSARPRPAGRSWESSHRWVGSHDLTSWRVDALASWILFNYNYLQIYKGLERVVRHRVHRKRGGQAIALQVGKDPIAAAAAECYLTFMGLILLIVVLIILFGGGGFYFGGPLIGGGGLGLILLICLIVFLMGGFRSRT